MSSKQKVNGRNYGSSRTTADRAKAPEQKLSENVIIAREALNAILKDDAELRDENKFLKAKLDQERQINRTLKKLIASDKVIG